MPRRRPGNRGTGGTIAVAILVLALTIPAVATGHQKGYDVFFGTVRSSDEGGTVQMSGSIFVEVEPHPKEACVPRRRIQLYEVLPGADRLLRSGRTDRFGRYQFTIPSGGADRTVALKLVRKVIRKDRRHLHYCEAQTATLDL
jgi:hypothetical protein